MREEEKETPGGYAMAFLGAVLVHPFVCIIVFFWGVLFGSYGGGSMMASGSTVTGKSYGLQGGLAATSAMGGLYMFFPPVALAISAVGSVVGFLLGLFRSKGIRLTIAAAVFLCVCFVLYLNMPY
jgi:hypothetical protein